MTSFEVNNLTIPANFSLQRIGITQSALTIWKTCRRKWLFWVNRWERVEPEKWAYHSMMHFLLEVLYKTRNASTVYAELEKYKLSGNPQEAEESKALAAAVLQEYMTYYIDDLYDFKFEAVEHLFSVYIMGYRLLGKIDGIFSDGKHRWIMEHKNYSRISEDYLSKHLYFDFQNLFYIRAQMLEDGAPVKGTLYNIIRKPETRKERSSNELFNHILSEIAKDPKHYFIRYEIPYSMEEVNSFEAELVVQLRELSQIITNCKSAPGLTLPYCYKNENACDGKFQCPFIDACALGTMQGYRKREHLFPELV